MSGFGVVGEKATEALELVEDHQVRFERINALAGQPVSKLAH